MADKTFSNRVNNFINSDEDYAKVKNNPALEILLDKLYASDFVYTHMVHTPVYVYEYNGINNNQVVKINKTEFIRDCKASSQVSPEQIISAKTFGIDIKQHLSGAIYNELSSNINNAILNSMYSLGWFNHLNDFRCYKKSLNIAILKNANEDRYTKGYPTSEDNQELVQLPITNYIINTPDDHGKTLQDVRDKFTYEFSSTVENIVYNKIKNGNVDTSFVIINTRISHMLTEGLFCPDSENKTAYHDNKEIYYLGKLTNGIKIYCNPVLRYDDTRVLVGNPSNKNYGVKLAFYDVENIKVETENITDNGISPINIVSKARCNISTVGESVHLNYFTFFVDCEKTNE